MTEPIRLHARIYRARSVAQAVKLVAEGWDGALSRRREGDYHVIEAEGGKTSDDAEEALAEVANAALVLTVEAEARRRG